MAYPLYSNDLIDHDIIDTSFCPKVENKLHLISGTNVIDTSNIQDQIIGITDVNSDTATGCYIVPDTNGIKCPNNKSMGLKYLINDVCYNICHVDNVQQIYTFFDDPNKLSKFFKLVFATIFTLIITAVIGTCYEFWLRYGDNEILDCMSYKSNCKNIGKNEEISIVDYVFPKNICYYPYQDCKSSSSGGKMKGGDGKIHSKYNDSECRTKKRVYDGASSDKAFPYNIADFAEENIGSEILKLPIKAFSFYFLFTVLLSRYLINMILSNISKIYNKNINPGSISNNIVFLLLTGLFFPIIAYITKNNSLSYGVGSWLMPFFSIISVCGLIGPLFALIITCMPEKLLEKYTETCKYGVDSKYYGLLSLNNLYNTLIFIPQDESIVSKTIAYLKSFLFILFIGLPIIILQFILAGAGNIIATIYMNFSFILNFFAIPLSNPLEFFNIIKNHGDLLTILFCIGVVGSSGASFSKTTTGIMGLLLAGIIFYKIAMSSK